MVTGHTSHEKKLSVSFVSLRYWVVVSNMIYFHTYLGKIPILTNIFQMGWNHQLVFVSLYYYFGFQECCFWQSELPSKILCVPDHSLVPFASMNQEEICLLQIRAWCGYVLFPKRYFKRTFDVVGCVDPFVWKVSCSRNSPMLLESAILQKTILTCHKYVLNHMF